jgi:hypothetical protein
VQKIDLSLLSIFANIGAKIRFNKAITAACGVHDALQYLMLQCNIKMINTRTPNNA